jgi:hypothetical protein
VDASDLVALRIHDVDRSFVEEMAELGYEGMTVDEALLLRIFDVDEDFIDAMRAEGLDGFTIERVIGMRVLDLDEALIRAIRSRGSGRLTVDMLLRRAGHSDWSHWKTKENGRYWSAMEAIIADITTGGE